MFVNADVRVVHGDDNGSFGDRVAPFIKVGHFFQGHGPGIGIPEVLQVFFKLANICLKFKH